METAPESDSASLSPARATHVHSAPGTCLRTVDGIPLLFVPERQLLFRADPFAAGLWEQLREGMSMDALDKAAAAEGLDAVQIVSDLLDAGVLVPIGSDEAIPAIAGRMFLRVGALQVCLNFDGPRAQALVRGMLAHLETAPVPCELQLVIREEESRIGVALNGEETGWCSWEQIGPELKILLTDLALESLDGIALHTALLETGGDALLLVGMPGAGKSTLSVALGRSGFGLEGDDIAALHADGRASALPFPATVKDGSWPLLAPLCPELEEKPAFLRPDDKIVRYLPLSAEPEPPRRPVRTVLCLDRSSSRPAGLEPLGVEAAMAALLEGAWSEDERLSTRAFTALTACIGGARFFRMTYDSLEEAIELARRACETGKEPG